MAYICIYWFLNVNTRIFHRPWNRWGNCSLVGIAFLLLAQTLFNLDMWLRWAEILEELNHTDKAWRCCILWFVNIHDRPCYRPIKLTFILLVQKDTKYIISVGHNSDLNLTTWQENYIFKKIKGPFASTQKFQGRNASCCGIGRC